MGLQLIMIIVIIIMDIEGDYKININYNKDIVQIWIYARCIYGKLFYRNYFVNYYIITRIKSIIIDFKKLFVII